MWPESWGLALKSAFVAVFGYCSSGFCLLSSPWSLVVHPLLGDPSTALGDATYEFLCLLVVVSALVGHFDMLVMELFHPPFFAHRVQPQYVILSRLTFPSHQDVLTIHVQSNEAFVLLIMLAIKIQVVKPC